MQRVSYIGNVLNVTHCMSLAMAQMIHLCYILKHTEREDLVPAEPCGILGWEEKGFDGQINQIPGSFLEGMSLEGLVDFFSSSEERDVQVPQRRQSI